jgi:hypothetical protein
MHSLDSRAGKDMAVSALIIVFLFYTIAWLSPETNLRKVIIEPVRPFFLFWGLNQNWRLFSPVIRNINYHSEAILTMADGSRLVVEMPRMERLNMLERFRLEKYRKWSSDSLPWPDYKEFWPDFARYIGRRHYNKANKPISLSLNTYWIETPPLSADGGVRPLAKLPRHTKMMHVFFYQYRKEDLP